MIANYTRIEILQVAFTFLTGGIVLGLAIGIGLLVG